MPVNLDDRAVDERVFEIGIVRQRGENPLEHALERPSAEALPHRTPLAKGVGQIAPWRPGAHNPQHRFNEPTIVFARPAGVAFLAGQERSNPLPLGVVQQQANQGWPPVFQP